MLGSLNSQYGNCKDTINMQFLNQIKGVGLVRNELMHTDIRTGKSKSLRTHRAEEPPIDMVRVSHLKQVCIYITCTVQ